MELIINEKYLIDTPIMEIVTKLKSELVNGKLSQIINKGNQVLVTCPFHKEGKENKPSCYIYCSKDDPNFSYGCFHCFSCDAKGQLYDFVAACFDETRDFGKKWLIDNFGVFLSSPDVLLEDPIALNTPNKAKSLDSNDLDKMEDYHPYMEKRKLSREICEEFNIKYDPLTHSIVFPVYDDRGNLVFLTRRNVFCKNFNIEKDVDKPVYLLNFIKQKNIKEVYVCESQINALYLWSLGYPAIALLGTGTRYQYDILNKSGISFYHLCFDGDDAGDKGIQRFFKNIKPTSFIDVVKIPRGKDINDLNQEEVNKLLNNKNI